MSDITLEQFLRPLSEALGRDAPPASVARIDTARRPGHVFEKMDEREAVRVFEKEAAKVGIRTNAEICGIAGLAFLGGSYMAEAFRSGLEAIEPIQTESAYSLGMNRWQTMRYIILPQAMSTSMPAFMANVIFLLKETSVFSAISLMDLMFTAKDLIGMYSKTIECLFLLVVFYLIILLPVSIVGSLIERRLRYAGFGS